MITEIWLFLLNGIPVWNARLDNGDKASKIDNALISGLLTATSSFADEALGSGQIKDLVLRDQILHQFPILDKNAMLAVLIDSRVDIEKLDRILEKTNEKMLLAITNAKKSPKQLVETDVNTQITFQELLEPMFQQMINDLKIYNEYLIRINSNEFDSKQIILLQKIPEIIPFLSENALSLRMNDIITKKTHFTQNYANIRREFLNELDELLKKFEESELLFNQAQLVRYISYLFFGEIAVAMFMLNRNLFIVVGKIQPEKYNKFEKVVQEVKKRILIGY